MVGAKASGVVRRRWRCAFLDAADAEVQARAEALDTRPTPTAPARHLAALRDRALLRLLADLGLRIGEALALDVDALTHNQGQRTVRYVGKGGKRRERPLTPYAVEASTNTWPAGRSSPGCASTC